MAVNKLQAEQVRLNKESDALEDQGQFAGGKNPGQVTQPGTSPSDLANEALAFEQRKAQGPGGVAGYKENIAGVSTAPDLSAIDRANEQMAGMRKDFQVNDANARLDEEYLRRWDKYGVTTQNGVHYYKDANGDIHALRNTTGRTTGNKYMPNPDGTYTYRTTDENGVPVDKIVTQQQMNDLEYGNMSYRDRKRNEDADSIYEEYVELRDRLGREPTDAELEARFNGRRLWNFNRVIGNQSGSVGDALGFGQMFGTFNKKTREALDKYYREQKGIAEETAGKINSRNAQISERDDDGKLVDAKPVYTTADGREVSAEDLGYFRQWARKYGTMDPRKIPREAIMEFQTNATRILGRDVKVDGIWGTQTTGAAGELSGLWALIQQVEPGSDLDELLNAAGISEDPDGKVRFMPSKEEIAERLTKQNAKDDIITQQRDLTRRQNRLGLSEIFANIGDSIRASGGAQVNPRDYRAMYESLDARQKQNFDAYQARMDKLREEERQKAERLRQEKVAQAERLRQEKRQDAQRQEDRAWQVSDVEAQRAYDAEQKRLDRENQRAINNDRLDSYIDRLQKKFEHDEKLAILKSRYGDISTQSIAMPWTTDGDIAIFGKNEAKAVYEQLTGVLKTAMDRKPALKSIINMPIDIGGYNQYQLASIVGRMINESFDQLSAEEQDEIKKIINRNNRRGYLESLLDGAPGSGVYAPQENPAGAAPSSAGAASSSAARVVNGVDLSGLGALGAGYNPTLSGTTLGQGVPQGSYQTPYFQQDNNNTSL